MTSPPVDQRQLISPVAVSSAYSLLLGIDSTNPADLRIVRGQLQHLIDMSERPHVRLQVMPFGFGGHSGESGAFTILSFPESDLSDVVYLEQLTSALYLDKREDVAQYETAIRELQKDSPSPAESRDLLRGLLQLA